MDDDHEHPTGLPVASRVEVSCCSHGTVFLTPLDEHGEAFAVAPFMAEDIAGVCETLAQSASIAVAARGGMN